jgi:hypothetical protein
MYPISRRTRIPVSPRIHANGPDHQSPRIFADDTDHDIARDRHQGAAIGQLVSLPREGAARDHLPSKPRPREQNPRDPRESAATVVIGVIHGHADVELSQVA